MRAAARLIAAGLLAAGLAASPAKSEVLNPSAHYPEGPLWTGRALYYAEMTRDQVTVWKDGRNRAVWREAGCGPTSLAPGPEGSLWVLCHHAHQVVRISAAGRTLAVHRHDGAGRRLTRPNDSIADARGGLYISSSGEFDRRAPKEGAIFYKPPGADFRRVVHGLHYANGLVLGDGGKVLFVSEHLARRVLRFRVRDDGTLAGREVFVRLDDLAPPVAGADPLAGPDGLATDRAGNVYIVEYGAGRMLIVDGAGVLKHVLTIPEKYVTNVDLNERRGVIYVTAPGSNSTPPYLGRVRVFQNPLAHGR